MLVLTSLPLATFFALTCSLISHINKWFKSILLDILASGPMPKHVAFVMDGNRRYARKLGKEGRAGHRMGFETLLRTLRYCIRLGIPCVTVYAFAIDNFKRSEEELDTIMELFIEPLKHDKILTILDTYGVRVNFLGRRELLPFIVQTGMAKIENKIRHHTARILNVCAPYASQDEITTAVESVIQKAIHAGDQDGSTITEDSIDHCLSTSLAGSPLLDILVRTSGVKRLSGFLLWQCCENTQIHFVDTAWPEFGLYDLVPILLEYQRKVWTKVVP